MKRLLLLLPLAAVILSACSMMHEDRDDCPFGLYVKFKYDYNLQRADMFNYHAGAVTLYVFDEQGNFILSRTDTNTEYDQPLECPCYRMHITDLPAGRYNFIALAAQNGEALSKHIEDSATTTAATLERSRFRTPAYPGDTKGLSLTLDRQPIGSHLFKIENNQQPLDTLWHGLSMKSVELSDLRPTYDTISLVRDTKKINVTLRELDDPAKMDINDYDLRIVDRNSHLLWDNTVEESDTVVYTPHAVWNTADRDTVAAPGRIGHADFMTSRIIYHDNPSDDGVLEIKHRKTGNEIARVNLPDMLSRLRRYEDINRYSPQEFLDRGYDYQLDFYLKGDKLKYVNISISVLSWSMRVQFEELK